MHVIIENPQAALRALNSRAILRDVNFLGRSSSIIVFVVQLLISNMRCVASPSLSTRHHSCPGLATNIKH
jgi:hypothetical protein